MALTRLSQRSQVGLGFKAKGDLPAAIRHFEQAISYDPGYARGYNNLGNALQATAHMPHRSIRPTWRLDCSGRSYAWRFRGLHRPVAPPTQSSKRVLGSVQRPSASAHQ